MPGKLPDNADWDQYVGNHPSLMSARQRRQDRMKLLLQIQHRASMRDMQRRANKRMHIPRDYDEYLQSDHWKQRRTRALELSKYQCQRCSIMHPDAILQVHHLSYKHLGDERDRELLVLCRDCHKKEHSVL